MKHEGDTLKVLKVGRELGRVMMTLAGLLGALMLLALIPVGLLDMLTLGNMQPPVVAWLRDVLTLHYSVTQVWTALPLHEKRLGCPAACGGGE